MKTPLAKAKITVWELLRKINFHIHGNVCYTCGATDLEGSNRHLGHFITKSTCSASMAYDLDNLRPQCYSCNIHKSGNWVAFEAHLMLDKGRNFPTLLKKRNRESIGKKYDILWYNNKIVELQNVYAGL